MDIKKTSMIITALVLSVSTSVIQASVIYDNGTFNPANNGAGFSEGTSRLADNFSISSSETIRSTQFWGIHWSSGVIPEIESFTAVIYGDNGGLPDSGNIIGTSSLTLVSRVDTGFDHNSHPRGNILEYTMNFDTDILLPFAGDYWFSVFLDEVPNTNWAWQETGSDADGSKSHSNNSGVDWNNPGGGDLAFNISNTYASAVPVPAAVWLFGSGLIGLISVARRKK